MAALEGSAAKTIIEQAAQAAREMLGMDLAYVADTRDGLLYYRVVSGDGKSFGAAVDRCILLEGTCCERLLAGRLDNILGDDRARSEVARSVQGNVGAYIGVPVVLQSGEVYGTFCCLSHDRHPSLGARDVRFMKVFARLIGDQLEREELETGRAETTAENVHGLLMALEARDGYTEAHSQAVVELALATARTLGVPDEELLDVENAALLHDIGKIGVPDAVLHKPDKLNEAEWLIMRRHPVVGERIVASMKTLAHLAPVVRAEHERWDGEGYPDGLRGEEIPLAARIILVSDACHAMTSDRPYRKALDHPTAISELARNAGTQFCPISVGAALSALSGQDAAPPRPGAAARVPGAKVRPRVG